MAQSRPLIVLDCDPGVDDALAIALAVDHCEVLALTAVGGNVAVEHTARNAGSVLALLGVDLDVHVGADHPLRGPLPKRAEEYHGETGLGSVSVPPPGRPLASHDAPTFLANVMRSAPGLWVVATGPLTNVALALRLAPDAWQYISGISWMGGSTTGGNVTPGAEFNAWADPEAAAEVFTFCTTHRVDLRMAGLNVTHEVTMNEDDVDRLQISPTGKVFAELIGTYLAQYRSRYTLRGAAVHDALAVVAITHPDLCQFQLLPVEIDVTDGPNRGRTTVDDRPLLAPATPNCRVMVDANESAIVSLLATSLIRTR